MGLTIGSTASISASLAGSTSIGAYNRSSPGTGTSAGEGAGFGTYS